MWYTGGVGGGGRSRDSRDDDSSGGNAGALIGILVGEFFAASEGIGYAIARFGDLFALDRMFACILCVMIIAVVLTEGIRYAERAAFPWKVGQ